MEVSSENFCFKRWGKRLTYIVVDCIYRKWCHRLKRALCLKTEAVALMWRIFGAVYITNQDEELWTPNDAFLFLSWFVYIRADTFYKCLSLYNYNVVFYYQTHFFRRSQVKFWVTFFFNYSNFELFFTAKSLVNSIPPRATLSRRSATSPVLLVCSSLAKRNMQPERLNTKLRKPRVTSRALVTASAVGRMLSLVLSQPTSNSKLLVIFFFYWD